MRRNSFDISTIILLATVLGAAAGSFGIYKYVERDSYVRLVAEAEHARREAKSAPVLTVTSTASVIKSPLATTSTPSQPAVSGAFNLDIAFFPQAPKKVWDVLHEDYCEEAALLGVHAFLQNKKYTIDQMEQELSKMYDWQMKNFGYFESTELAMVERIAREYLGYKNVRIIENPTLDMIRDEVAAGRPVIVPANGKMLKNPYFKNGGPMFHMYIIRGFTANGDVITNDPGTQHGENYVYKKDVVMAALRDWDHGQDKTRVATGIPRVLVIE